MKRLLAMAVLAALCACSGRSRTGTSTADTGSSNGDPEDGAALAGDTVLAGDAAVDTTGVEVVAQDVPGSDTNGADTGEPDGWDPDVSNPDIEAPDTGTADSSEPDVAGSDAPVADTAADVADEDIVPDHCGDGALDPGETCDSGPENGATPCGCQHGCIFGTKDLFCGATTLDGPCDLADVCDGMGSCQNRFAPTVTECLPAVDVCDTPEYCTGTSPDCPPDTGKPDGLNCSSDPVCATPPCSCTGRRCVPDCGNGHLDESELCDDGAMNGARHYCSISCGSRCGVTPASLTSGGAARDNSMNALVVDEKGVGYGVGSYWDEDLPAVTEFAGQSFVKGRGFDVLVAAVAPGGAAVWTACAGGPGWDLGIGAALDPAGLWVVGSFESTMAFGCCKTGDPTTGCPTVTSSGAEQDAFAARYDRVTGALLWVRSGGQAGVTEYLDDVAVQTDLGAVAIGRAYGPAGGSVVFGGLSAALSGQNDVLLVAYAPDGDVRWVRTLGGEGYEQARHVAADPKGNIYFLGLAADPVTLTLGDLTLTTTDRYTTFATSLAPDGAPRWLVPVMEATGGLMSPTDTAWGCRPTGECAVYGAVTRLYDYPGYPGVVWEDRLSVVRLDPADGTMLGATLVAEGTVRSARLEVDGAGGVVLGMSFFGALSLENQPIIDLPPGPENNDWAAVLRLDSNLSRRWLTPLFGAGNSAGAIAVSPRGGAWVAGSLNQLTLGEFDVAKKSEGGDAYMLELDVDWNPGCATCGDGAKHVGEVCDDGDTDVCAGTCDAACQGPANVCGDGTARCGEAFDVGEAGTAEMCLGCVDACTVPNAEASCIDHSCVVETCAAGYGDCNESGEDGCEADLTLPDTCGDCKVACPERANATRTCSAAGACGYKCLPRFQNCNGDPSDGCEADLTTEGRCGACSKAVVPHATVTECSFNQGAFTITAIQCDAPPSSGCECNNGYNDCDGFPNNGCERVNHACAVAQNCEVPLSDAQCPAGTHSEMLLLPLINLYYCCP